MFLDYFALGILIFVVIFIFYGIIAIHDIPYEISKKRNHPHQDAIHVAGWVSLFTLHVLWPFLWIWATLWREDRGWGFTKIKQEQDDIHHKVDTLTAQVTELKKEILYLTQSHNQPNHGNQDPIIPSTNNANNMVSPDNTTSTQSANETQTNSNLPTEGSK